MTSTRLPGPRDPGVPAHPGAPAPLRVASDPDPVPWARRLARIALGLLLLGVIGVVLAALTLGAVLESTEGDYAASPEQYPRVPDTAQVELQDQSALGLFYLEGGAAGSPDGDCQVTDPQGAPVPEAHGIAIQTPAIGPDRYVGDRVYPTTGPGTYTVTCAESGFRAGPAYLTSESAPGIGGEIIVGTLLVVSAALLVSGAPTVPLLLAAAIVRLVQGPRPGSTSRRRRDRGLSLLVVAGVGAIVQAAAITVVALSALLDSGDPVARHEAVSTALLALPVPLFLLVLAAIGALWWSRTSRAARQNLDLTVP